MSFIKKIIILAFFAAAMFAGVVQGAVPTTINYQGMLTDNTGKALTGTYSFVFSLSSGTGPTGWSETYSGLTVLNGLYTVQLGSVNNTLGNLPFDTTYYLTVQVGSEILSPAQPLATSPYAFRSSYADHLSAGAGAIPASSIAAGSLLNTVIASSIAVQSVGIPQIQATGTPTGATFLDGNGNWSTPSGTGNMIRSVDGLNIANSTASLQNQINSVGISTGNIETTLLLVQRSTYTMVSISISTGQVTGNWAPNKMQAGTLPNGVIVTTGSIYATGTASGVTYLDGSGNWSTPSSASLNSVAASTTSLQNQINSVGISTGTISVQVNSISLSTGSLQTQITSTALSTGTFQSQINSLGISTGTILTQVNSISLSTGSLQTQITSTALSTGTFQSQINSLGISTGTILTQVNSISLSTGSLQAQITSTALSTGTFQSQINSLGISTGTLLTQVNSISLSTGSLQTQITSTALSTGTFQSQINSLGISTGTLLTQVNSISLSTGSLQAQITSTALSTGTFQSQINSLGISTGTILTQVNSISLSTGSLQAQITSTALSTGTFQSQINSLGISTGTIYDQVNNISLSTGSLQSQINSLGISTGTLLTQLNSISLSTGSLQAQITSTALSTGTFQSQINSLGISTGTISDQVNSISLSTGSLQIQITNTALSTGTLSSTLVADYENIHVGTATYALTIAPQSAAQVTPGVFGGSGDYVFPSGAPLTAVSSVTFTNTVTFQRTDITLTNTSGETSDLNIGNATFVRLVGATAGFNISGFTGGYDGRLLIVYNSSTYALTLDNDADSSAGNRIYTGGAGAVTQGAFTLIYDGGLPGPGHWVVTGW